MPPTLASLAVLFLKLGTLAFGGPAAHIAMMEDEVVRRRRWLSRAQFLDYLGATNLIPGPNSTELAIHVGQAMAGWRGMLVAGACFILPATLIVAAIAWAYVRYGALPAAAGILYGVKPVVIAVVLQAIWGLGRSAVKSATLGVLAAAAVATTAMGVNELAVLVAAGAVAALLHRARRPSATRTGTWGLLALLPHRTATPDGAIADGLSRAMRGAAGAAATAAVTGAAAAAPFSLWALFGVFAKIGAILFGSGYVLLAFMRADLVVRLGWLSERQLLDAVAVGQVTPGPVFTTATFVGYVLGGPGGAAVATVGIFLPAFVFVALSGLLLPQLRRSETAGAVLDGVNVASLALMLVVTVQLGPASLVDSVTVTLALVSAVLLFRYRVNSAWLVAFGATAGLLTEALGRR